MRDMMFSILVVSLNAGKKLKQTIQSILEQDCRDYEVVVKDGGSKDGSVEALEVFLDGLEEADRKRIRIIRQPDKSIYEGMNQATGYAMETWSQCFVMRSLLFCLQTLQRSGCCCSSVRWIRWRRFG